MVCNTRAWETKSRPNRSVSGTDKYKAFDKQVARQCQHGEGRTADRNLLCPETTQLLSHWSVVEAPRWFSPLSTMVGHPGMIRGKQW